MELGEKIQKLRREQGLTQEQLAEQLFVSRTAVSKWETGRGTPSIDTLTALARIFGVTLDSLLCAEEIAVIAKRENKNNVNRVDAVFDIIALLFLLLPLYRMENESGFVSVPLYSFSGWLLVLYFVFPMAITLCGLVKFFINGSDRENIKKVINIVSVTLSIIHILILVLSVQPYPAFCFITLFIIRMIPRVTRS